MIIVCNEREESNMPNIFLFRLVGKIGHDDGIKK